eukprot:TRINITY_DN6456_c0_g1_i1.p1 TRINITY_DN6456_c0_g1~~TRINITY_DN6456_c0_g1_i1.p1  ORF type:complete len:123 (-),score=12.02 TRINITY_DN6456_c0_g1_i1:289-657(-)
MLKADIRAREVDGNTALMWACKLGHAGCVEVLLENGADIDARNLNDETALKLAIEWNHFGVCKLLLQKILDVENATFSSLFWLHKDLANVIVMFTISTSVSIADRYHDIVTEVMEDLTISQH